MTKRWIVVREARQHLLDCYGIERNYRTVREWIKKGFIEGRIESWRGMNLYVTTRDAITLAVVTGRIPPRRGNPNFAKVRGCDGQPMD